MIMKQLKLFESTAVQAEKYNADLKNIKRLIESGGPENNWMAFQFAQSVLGWPVNRSIWLIVSNNFRQMGDWVSTAMESHPTDDLFYCDIWIGKYRMELSENVCEDCDNVRFNKDSIVFVWSGQCMDEALYRKIKTSYRAFITENQYQLLMMINQANQ